MEHEGKQRFDRVYVRRRGRMTSGQARALETLRPTYCRDETQFLAEVPPAGAAGARIGVEIGFGMGQALVDWCVTQPGWDIVGLEVYEPGIGAALLRAAEAEVHNLTIVERDASQVLEASPAMPWIDELRIFFPDPWPKKRHAKRRIVQPEFLRLVAKRLRPGGLLRLATDWQPYADWMNDVLRAEPLLHSLGDADGYAPRFAERGTTNFEARGERLGHAVRDFLYERSGELA
ncbi:MAG: tRNA (guanosine(46)-N7)-methyltransferase TrmB [Pseudomonadota bacterium]